MFDRAPRQLKGKALQDWECATFKGLIEGVAENHGTAFAQFMRSFVANQAAWTEKAARLQQQFEAKMKRRATSRVRQDIIAEFGLLFAGGVLAWEAGILPFKRGRIGGAIARACSDALAILPNPERDLAADLSGLAEQLASGAIVDLATASQKQRRLMSQADGFVERKTGGSEYVIRAQTFSDWFRSDARVRRMLEWLSQQGFLKHTKDPGKQRSNAWAQQQRTWPDGTRQRSIVIYLPRGTRDLDPH